VLLYHAPLSGLAERRLRILRETDDGFRIAEEDLRLRGPGEVLGTRQTGLMTLRVADLLRDQALLPAVRRLADEILRRDEGAATALIDRWIGAARRYGQV
jgi:ATP-dependent DNA helicase RecG